MKYRTAQNGISNKVESILTNNFLSIVNFIRAFLTTVLNVRLHTQIVETCHLIYNCLFNI